MNTETMTDTEYVRTMIELIIRSGADTKLVKKMILDAINYWNENDLDTISEVPLETPSDSRTSLATDMVADLIGMTEGRGAIESGIDEVLIKIAESL